MTAETEILLNPQMIVLARESRGLSQKELADKLGITAALLSLVEQGTRTLREELITKLCKLLNYPMDFFTQEGEAYIPMSLRYRKRDHVSAKVLVPLEAQINIFRLNIEALYKKIKFPQVNVPSIQVGKDEPFEKIAKQLRKEWKVQKGRIENMTEILEKNGIIVLCFDFGTERVDSRTIITKDKVPVIVLNKLHLADRQRFSLAHELGHLVMHTQTMASFNRDISHEANMFAAGFLMPEAEIKKDFENGITIPLLGELKQKWKVSMQAILYRATDFKIVSENQKRYLLQQFNQSGMRRREPVELDFPKEPPTLLRNLITNYKTKQKLSLKEISSFFHLLPEEFSQKYS